MGGSLVALLTNLRIYGFTDRPPSLPVPRPGRETPRSTRLAEGSSSPISLVVCVWFLYLHRCRSRGPAVQGATGSGRTWQRRSVATPPFFRPTRYPPSPTLPPAARLRAARAHARALAHRISVCALSSEAPITPGIHGRRGVPPEARIEAPAPSTRRDPRHHQPLPGNTASAFPLIALRIPQIPQGDAFLPGGQLERPLSWLGRARLPAHLRVLTATTPAAVLSPPRATRIRSRTACNRRAAPLPSIVGAGIEDPCAICPEICGVTRPGLVD